MRKQDYQDTAQTDTCTPSLSGASGHLRPVFQSAWRHFGCHHDELSIGLLHLPMLFLGFAVAVHQTWK